MNSIVMYFFLLYILFFMCIAKLKTKEVTDNECVLNAIIFLHTCLLSNSILYLLTVFCNLIHDRNGSFTRISFILASTAWYDATGERREQPQKREIFIYYSMYLSGRALSCWPSWKHVIHIY